MEQCHLQKCVLITIDVRTLSSLSTLHCNKAYMWDMQLLDCSTFQLYYNT